MEIKKVEKCEEKCLDHVNMAEDIRYAEQLLDCRHIRRRRRRRRRRRVNEILFIHSIT
jgi:hypothetical protein